MAGPGPHRRARWFGVLGALLCVAAALAGPVAGAQAAAPGGITGTVSDATSHAPIANAFVVAYSAGGAYVSETSTNAQGQYDIVGLTPGSYRLQVEANAYLTSFYNGESTLASADPVIVSAGQTTPDINVAMQLGGQISGTVTDAGTGKGEPGIYVEIYATSSASTTTTSATTTGFGATGATGASGPVPPPLPFARFYGSAETDLGGHYTVSGLPAGSFAVAFEPGRGQAYGMQYYNDRVSLATADAVPVTLGADTGNINASLRAQGVITGTVTAASSHAALSGIEVEVYDAAGNVASTRYTTTDDDGQYTVGGLPVGSYKVAFFDSISGNNYAPQDYNDQGSLGSASTVTVSAGATTSGIDAALQPGGQIAGTVTDAATHAPLVGMNVDAYDSSGNLVYVTQTDASGDYLVGDLATGSYRLGFGFAGAAATTSYVPQFYSGAATLASASAIAVTAGVTTAKINQASVSGGRSPAP